MTPEIPFVFIGSNLYNARPRAFCGRGYFLTVFREEVHVFLHDQSSFWVAIFTVSYKESESVELIYIMHLNVSGMFAAN